MISKVATLALGLVVAFGNSVSLGQLYTEGPGVNPPFEDIRDQITNGYSGTTIDVNNSAVEGGFFGDFGTQNDLRMHTLSQSSVQQGSFGNWSRWYQTDGDTQIFRLFPGEENVRNDRPLAARIETFDINNGWNVDDGIWSEWVGRYTIVEPISAAILQVKDQDDDDWSVQLNMNAEGRVSVQHRRPREGQPKNETLIENAIGQSFDIRVRDNGLDYEVYFEDFSQPFTTGTYARNTEPGDNSDTRFRWGMYVGGNPVVDEGMIFVSHATVNPDIDYPIAPIEGSLIAGWETWSSGSESASSTDFGATGLATESSGDWREGSEAASNDGTFGPSGGASMVTNSTSRGTHIGVTTGSGSYDFTVTAGPAGLELESFNFDAQRKRTGSPENWTVSTISGAITTGVVLSSGSLGNTLGSPGPSDHDDFQLDLRTLADNILEPGESATIRIEFTGGTVSNTDQKTYLDNVAFFGLSLVEEAPGDFNGDGIVDLADYSVWRNNLGESDSTLHPGSTDTGSAFVDAGEYSLWKANLGSSYSGGTGFSQIPVPEPTAGVLLALMLITSRSRWKS